jgi:hypothetical protein
MVRGFDWLDHRRSNQERVIGTAPIKFRPRDGRLS